MPQGIEMLNMTTIITAFSISLMLLSKLETSFFN